MLVERQAIEQARADPHAVEPGAHAVAIGNADNAALLAAAILALADPQLGARLRDRRAAQTAAVMDDESNADPLPE